MPDFRILDTADEHPKLRAAGPAAVGLWAMAGARAMHDLTDGWVPEHYVVGWPSGKRLAATLVKVGLWSREERAGVAGYRFHDWRQVQRSASQIETERAKARDRSASRRTSARSSGERSGERRPNGHRDADRTSSVTTVERPPERSAEVPAKAGRTFGGAPYPLHPEGVVGGESSGSERAGEATIPPEKLPEQEERQPCGRHHDPSEPCGGCGAARRAAAQQQDRAEAEQTAADRAAAQRVRECPMCDADGRLLEVGRFLPVAPATTCDHVTGQRQQVADARGEAS